MLAVLPDYLDNSVSFFQAAQIGLLRTNLPDLVLEYEDLRILVRKGLVRLIVCDNHSWSHIPQIQ